MNVVKATNSSSRRAKLSLVSVQQLSQTEVCDAHVVRLLHCNTKTKSYLMHQHHQFITNITSQTTIQNTK